MRAREELMKSDVFGDVSKNYSNYTGKSDSASMDMVIEPLLMTGRSFYDDCATISNVDDKKHSYEFILHIYCWMSEPKKCYPARLMGRQKVVS
jgi:hypothetical protein